MVVSDVNRSGADETVGLIQSAGGRAIARPADVGVEQQFRDLIAFAEETYGALHILVNNASGPFYPDQPLEHWLEIVQTDFLGTIYGTRLAIDALRRAGGGAIVNISSISALWHGRLHASPGYDAAKAGVIRLTTMLTGLGETDGIRVNCLAPGWIASEQVRAYWEPLTPEQRIERGAPARLLQLDEVAAAVLRLATDRTLYGRVMVWWSEDEPKLIPWGDPGYASLI